MLSTNRPEQSFGMNSPGLCPQDQLCDICSYLDYAKHQHIHFIMLVLCYRKFSNQNCYRILAGHATSLINSTPHAWLQSHKACLLILRFFPRSKTSKKSSQKLFEEKKLDSVRITDLFVIVSKWNIFQYHNLESTWNVLVLPDSYLEWSRASHSLLHLCVKMCACRLSRQISRPYATKQKYAKCK